MRLQKSILLIFLGMAFLFQTSATTIVPFANLGEMAQSSDAVVLARATDNFIATNADFTFYDTRFQLVEEMKGGVADHFVVRGMNYDMNGLKLVVSGEMSFVEGQVYLMFLAAQEGGHYQLITLSHAVFDQFEKNQRDYLVPTKSDLHVGTAMFNGETAEPLAVYKKDRLISMLREISIGDGNWDKTEVLAPFGVDDFGTLRAFPNLCVPLFNGGTPARWFAFDNNQTIEVYADNNADVGYPGSQAAVGNSVDMMNQEYSGIDLVYNGITNFSPNCGGGSISGGNFTAHANGLNGQNTTIVSFNDPCSQIPNLGGSSGCSGTLAIGGHFATSPFLPYDGRNFYQAIYGYVSVNNGVGACQSATGFQRMLIHELTHTMSLGHIAFSSGSANMNPSCCNPITEVTDVVCMDYLYEPLGSLPVELTGFSANLAAKLVDLKWETASENQNQGFEIERSADGRNWENIGWTPGFGTTSESQSYSFTDDRPLFGESYYRLKQLDDDGNFEYSDLRSITYYNDRFEIIAYPNPTRGTINLSVTNPESQNMEISVKDMLQREVFNSGQLEATPLYERDLNLENTGLYLITTKIGNEVFTKKIMVIE